MIFKSQELYYIVFMYKYYQVNLFLILIEKVDQKLNFQHWLAWTQPYKSQIWPKRGENVIFNCRKWYYKVFMYKYYKLNLVLQSYYAQLLLINLVSGFNLEVWLKLKLLTPISLN